MHFGKGAWRTFERGIEREWLVTNGLGGFASSTLINANTRRYHGLLVAAHNPPGRRTLHLAKLDEGVRVGETFYNLATNETAGGLAEFGFVHLQRVIVDPLPTFIYSFGDLFLVKKVGMVHGANTTVILYRIHNGPEPGTLILRPMVNCRGYHYMTAAGEIDFRQEPLERGVLIRGRDDVPALRLVAGAGAYRPGEGYWYRDMAYAAERERGETAREDHFVPGRFEVPLAPGAVTTVTILASTEEDLPPPDGEALLRAEEARLAELAAASRLTDPLARRLVQAADAFIVERRSTGAKTVIAGYPWFTDWARDTMIALPGLTLVTGRWNEAREILLTYARQERRGLLPNAFKVGAAEPLYNTVDAPLWFFLAAYKYLQYTGDDDFIRTEIYPVLRKIAAWYVRGTDFGIQMDDDGLIRAGAPDVQLTWMDAKVDEWVVTPRHGKPVEIQALWYNALRVLQKLAARYGDEDPYPRLPERVRESFLRSFWIADAGGGWLADVVGDERAVDARVRPNQILAVSLPHTMLDRDRARQVVRKVWRELYVTYGLRSLDPADPDYRGYYRGDRVARDGAYHQGTAWSWLIGPFVTAYRRAEGYSPASRRRAAAFLAPFEDHLRDHGVGYISEIFDGNEPAVPRGCIAQAWGVAEILRAYVEDVLERGPETLSKGSVK